MIIRIYPYMTLKASPLNNRSVCGMSEGIACTLKECPISNIWATPSGSMLFHRIFHPGVLRTPRLLKGDPSRVSCAPATER
ncbi:MAG: hypothetical protein J5548_15780 [Prevotella sp.]|nr:hypothetical protein [Prevotella sp.]